MGGGEGLVEVLVCGDMWTRVGAVVLLTAMMCLCDENNGYWSEGGLANGRRWRYRGKKRFVMTSNPPGGVWGMQGPWVGM